MSDTEHTETGLRLLAAVTAGLGVVAGVATMISAEEKVVAYGVTISTHVNGFLLYVGFAIVVSGLISAFVLRRIAIAFERTARIEEFLLRRNQVSLSETQSV